MTLLVPILVLSLAGQSAEKEVHGGVVNSKGEPAPGASVVLYLEYLGFPETDLVSTTADNKGQFHLPWPRAGNTRRGRTVNGNRSVIFAHRRGSALAVDHLSHRSHRLVLREAAPRKIAIRRADGKPLLGVKIMPRVIHVFSGSFAEIPAGLAALLGATTSPDGAATLTSLAPRDELLAVRVAGDSLAEQDIVLDDRPSQATRTGPLTVSLQTTSQISGRVVDERGQALPGQAVEVWTRGNQWLYPSPVEFAGGPVRTGPDGSFQTPPTLLAGSTFRVVVRAPGKDMVVGDWITLGQKPRQLPEIVLGELRTIQGRVVDRAGKPVAGAEVMQRGDGPEPTSSKTDAIGRFSLGGFRSRPAILFARREGFRFHGQVVRPAAGDVTVVLRLRDEPPDRVMKPLPYPDMPADSRAIARRLIDPILDAALQNSDPRAATRVLTNLAAVDPGAAQEKLDSIKLVDTQARDVVRLAVINNVAGADPEEAASLAEAIPDAGHAARALLIVVGALPAERRQLKLELLDRALLKARAATELGVRLHFTAGVANICCELGEVERARKLMAETLPVASQYAEKTDIRRGFFAAALARFNLPAALALVDDLTDRREKDRVLGLMAIQLAGTNPAEAERLWDEVKGTVYRESLEGCWRLALSDPVRARRIAAKSAQQGNPDYYIVLALGLSARHKRAARDAFEQGLEQVDGLIDEPQSDSRVRSFVGFALQLVDQIAPELAGEIFWRYLATRPSATDPRDARGSSAGLMIRYVAMYDRDLAKILFDPIRVRMIHAEGAELAEMGLQFEAWTMLDPSEAVAAALRLPIDLDRLDQSTDARFRVARALTGRERWRLAGFNSPLDFLPQP